MTDELSDLEIEGTGTEDDLALEPDPYEPAPYQPEPPPRRSALPWLLAAIVLLGAALAWWW